MSAAPVILLFLLLASRRKGAAWQPSYTLHHASPHGSHPSTGPAAFPLPPATLVPASMPSGPTFAETWKPYAPLNQAVIARAEQLLRDPSAPHEVIEPDPAGQGKVRYLKLNAPPGHWSVTAWKPTIAQHPPATAIPAIYRSASPAAAHRKHKHKGMRA
jgi:hypothetical protein